MFKHTQRICWQHPTNCFSVFDDFVGLALKGLMAKQITVSFGEMRGGCLNMIEN